MAEARARSGGGKTVATFPSGGGGGGGGGRGRGGGGGFAGGMDFGGLLDPGLLREAMLQSLSQRERGFEEWLKGSRQKRDIADLEADLLAEGGQRAERDFYQRNIPKSRMISPTTGNFPRGISSRTAGQQYGIRG